MDGGTRGAADGDRARCGSCAIYRPFRQLKIGALMPDAEVRRQVSGVGRVGITAAWVAAICCLPYLVLKVAWTLGASLGLKDASVRHSSDWVAENAVSAGVQLVGLLLVVALTRPWAQRLPAWLVAVPAWVGTGLLFQ